MIVFRHDLRRAHEAARIARHDVVRSRKVAASLPENVLARARQPRIGNHRQRLVGHDACGFEIFPRQIQSADSRILIDVAQDVRQLQRAAEMMRQQNAVFLAETEHPHREATDRAGDAIAIQIERLGVRRANVRRDIHLHAVDDGDEILAAQAELLHRRRIVLHPRGRIASIERIDIAPPLIERGKTFGARTVGIRDVVHLTAEAVDLEHGVALLARQNAHRRVERAAGRRALHILVRCAAMLRGGVGDGHVRSHVRSLRDGAIVP